jgi:hypothetical protein
MLEEGSSTSIGAILFDAGHEYFEGNYWCGGSVV